MKVLIDTKAGPQVINLNRRRAVRLRCYDCSGFNYAEVASCRHTDCSLHPFRSGQGRQDAKKRAAAIRAFCLWCMCDQRYEIAQCTCPTCSLYSYRNTKTDKSVEITCQGQEKAIYEGES